MRRFGFQKMGTRALRLPQPVEVQILVEAPQVAPEEYLYLASNLNGWNPRGRRYCLRRLSESRFFLTLQVRPGSEIAFKLTRGSWDRVETAAEGEPLPDRRIRVEGPRALELQVAAWRDARPRETKPSTICGDVRSLGELPIPQLQRSREVVVYLPPGYDREVQRHYPVMYLWDGQNLFNDATSYCGEWHVDEICDALIRQGDIPPLIVVGIYNGQEDRLDEQSPWPCPFQDVKGEGQRFTEWVATDLKAFMDQRFRTLKGPEHTGIGGSSMGGLTTMYAAYRFPEVFGRVMAMSSAFWFANKRIFSYVRERQKPEGSRIYLDCGYQEGAYRERKRMVRQSLEMRQILRSQGFQEGHDLRWVGDPAGKHSEADWTRRLPDALRFLWAATP